MLIIRKKQSKAFEQASLKKFEDEMVTHLKKFAPQHCEAIGEPPLRQAIWLGIERSAKYGFTNRGPVRFYIELMFMFGSDFDTDPQLVWAVDVLNNATLSDQMAKADRLYDKAMDCVAKIAGPNYDYAKRALQRVSVVKLEDFPPPDGRFEHEMMGHLKTIHPQKVQYLGEAKTRWLIEYGKLLPTKLSLAPDRGAALCVGAMFALGHGFGNDPLLPWIAHTITNPAITDSNVRVTRVHSKMMTYLDAVLANQDSEGKS